MPDSKQPKPVPENYRRIEANERRPAPDARFVREADRAQPLTVVIRVKASAGQVGIDQVAAFAREQGLVLVGTSVVPPSVAIWGTAAQFSEIFAVQLCVYESPAGTYRGWEGHLHLPAGLAEKVEGVLGLIEREIENIEHVIGNLLGQGEQKGSDAPRKVFDLIVPLSGPKGAVNPAAFSLVQEFDVDWLPDPGCQRLLDNMQASPVAFQTVRVMKVFTSGGTPEIGAQGTSSGGTVWPSGGSTRYDAGIALVPPCFFRSRGNGKNVSE
jgi:hypothetical protein